jgi:hypothetical protein
MSARGCSFTLYVGAPSFFRTDPFIQLAKLCQEYCGASYAIETRDTRDDLRAALRADVQETPTVFVNISGGPTRRLGNLAATEAFLKDYNAMKM